VKGSAGTPSKAPKRPELPAVREAVGRRKAEILAWLQDFVRCRSENRPPTGTEAAAQDFLETHCGREGWETRGFLPTDVPGIQKHRYWLPGREYPSGRRNFVARWKGSPGAGGRSRSLLFSGHADVAPFEPDNWTVCRPFEPRLVDGRLHGRGTADMKGGMAAAFWAMKILKGLGFTPAGDILFESVVDEEFAGGNGTLAGRLAGFNADLAVLTEPTRMQVCPACLGAFLGDITLRGKAGMPYMGSEIPNPIVGAARVIEGFQEWQKAWRKENSHPLFQEPGKQLNLVLSSIRSLAPGELEQMGTPLLTAISWIIWCYPGMTEAEFRGRFKRFWEDRFSSDPVLAPFSPEIQPTYHFVRPWETPTDHPGVKSVVEAYRAVTGQDPVVGGAPFSCDLGVYGDPGNMPCLILGPRGDNLHAPDEWVLLEDVYTLTEIFACLAAGWCV
jgi:acetylornithine deacetylase